MLDYKRNYYKCHQKAYTVIGTWNFIYIVNNYHIIDISCLCLLSIHLEGSLQSNFNE